MTGPGEQAGDAELDDRITSAGAALLDVIRARADVEPRFPPAPPEPEPRYPDVCVVLHATSAVISAGWAAQALRGYGAPDVAGFIAEIRADRYARAEQIIARWVTVTGRLAS